MTLLRNFLFVVALLTPDVIAMPQNTGSVSSLARSYRLAQKANDGILLSRLDRELSLMSRNHPDRLISFFKSTAPVQERAIVAHHLSEAGTQPAIEALVGATRSREAGMRMASFVCLENIRTAKFNKSQLGKIENACKSAFSQPNPDITYAALRLLSHIDKPLSRGDVEAIWGKALAYYVVIEKVASMMLYSKGTWTADMQAEWKERSAKHAKLLEMGH